MAQQINSKFITFATKEQFVSTNFELSNHSVVFINDTGEIYCGGKRYSGLVNGNDAGMVPACDGKGSSIVSTSDYLLTFANGSPSWKKLDSYVTLRGDQTITGSKRFTSTVKVEVNGGISLHLVSKSAYSGILFVCNNDSDTLTKQNGFFLYKGDSNYYLTDSNWQHEYKILHSGNSSIKDGVITINGSSITPLTAHQSLSNYVTLNGDQTISGVKTFSSQQKFTVAKGTAPFQVTSDTRVDNLNADLLDGLDSTKYLHSVPIINDQDFNVVNGIDSNGNCYYNINYALTADYQQTNSPYSYGMLTSLNCNAAGMEFATNGPLGTAVGLKFRKRWLNKFSEWKTVAFTDSDITGNASSATKLQTARTLTIGDTGKTFNGSANVSWDSTEIGFRHEWNATIKGTIWSRLCYVQRKYTTEGSTYILKVSATRSSVVYSNTYLITAHHGAGEGHVVLLGGSNYSQLEIRILTDNSGSSYVEILDNAYKITATSTQEVHCSLIPISCGTIIKYTEFTDGTTLPSGYASGEILKTLAYKNSIQASNFVGNLVGNAASATKLKTKRKLWGQDFDGSADVKGPLVDADFIRSNTTNGYFVGNRNNGLGVTDGGLLLFSYGDTPISLYTNHAERMIIKGDGKIGMGISNPSEKLEVNGNVKATSFIGNLNGNSNTATKLQTKRKLWGQEFDGSADVSGDMIGVGSIIRSEKNAVNTDSLGNLKFKESDVFQTWSIQNHNSVAQFVVGENGNTTVTGFVKAPTFQGNLDGTYVNKLTGYTKATAIAALATTDSLNTALGKLEYKADVTYDLVKGAYDGDGTIENLAEILKVLDGISDTDTIQAIIGKYLPLSGGTLTNIGNPLIIKRTDSNAPGLVFYHDDTQLGSLGITLAYEPYIYRANTGHICKIWHEGNDGSKSGLDADLLDGLHSDDFFKKLGTNEDINTYADSSNKNGILYINTTTPENINAPFRYGSILSLNVDVGSWMIACQSNGTLLYRSRWWSSSGNNWGNWNTFIHSGNYTSYLPFLNSTSTHANNTSKIYAPSTGGTANQVLISNGDAAPTWTNQSNIAAGSSQVLLADLKRPKDANYLESKGDGGIRQFKSSSAMTTNKPEFDGTILHFSWDNKSGWDSQLCIANGGYDQTYNHYIQWRGQDEGVWGEWKTVAFLNDIPTKLSQLTNDSGYLTSANLSNYVTLNTEQIITGKKWFDNQLVIRKDVGDTGASVTDQQHRLQLQVRRYSDTHSVAIGVMPTGAGVIWAKANGIGYNTLYLNPHSNGVAIGTNDNTLPNLNDGHYLHIFGSTLSTSSITATKFIGNLNHTLTFSAGTFSAKTYNNSAAVTVNIPTHTSHLTNNSGFLTQHQSLANYVTLNTAQTITGKKTFNNSLTINSTSTSKIPKLVIDEYYSNTAGNWISEIISDYYGTNVCSKPDFTHGLYIKLGRLEFNNLIVLNNDYSPIARISKDKGHWFNGSLTIDNGVGKSTIIYSEPQTASPTDNAQTVIKGINYTHKLVLKDSFAGGCNYATLSGGYIKEGILTLRSFNADTTNNTATVKATTTISTGNSTFAGNVFAPKFITSGGTSTQFVKGDGSLDSNTYATTTSLGNYLPLTGGVMDKTAYISWGKDDTQNDVNDWSTVTNVGLRIISNSKSTEENTSVPTRYCTALHVRGRYGFQLASQGGYDTTNFFIRNIANTKWNTILHSGNSYINNGIITINGTSITPLTAYQDLSNYVTLNTAQTITGSKTFTASTNTFSGTSAGILTVDRNSTNPAWIKFCKNGTLQGYIGITNDFQPVFLSGESGASNKILIHSGNYTSYLPFLNSTSTRATNTSVIYAPTSGGTSGQILKSNGSSAPTWVNQDTIAAGSAVYLAATSLNTEEDIVQSGVRAYSGNGADWTGEVKSMRYAAILTFGHPNRGFQMWSRRGDTSLRYRNGLEDASGWNTERIILDSNNYTSYLGYIGTTAVQASSAAQALTGITNLTMNGTYTNNNKLVIHSSGCIYPYSTSTRTAGMYGKYDSTKVGHVWSMGTDYKITDDGSSTNNMYGLVYFHTNWSNDKTRNTATRDGSLITEVSTYAGGHQIAFVVNGKVTASLGDRIWARAGFLKSGSSDSYVLLGGGGHKKLSDFMLKSEELTNNLTTITKTLVVSKDWVDTGIVFNAATFPNGTGSYIVQLSRNDEYYWTGYLSVILSKATVNTTDEIILHGGGVDMTSEYYLRTVSDKTTETIKLQIARSNTDTRSLSFTFKFKKLI